jgi:hypothetical protein
VLFRTLLRDAASRLLLRMRAMGLNAGWPAQGRPDGREDARESAGVIPGRSAAEGKGIHQLHAGLWIPFPR